MPKGSATSEASSGENISHFAAIRVRVTGTGQLKMSVRSLGISVIPNVGFPNVDTARNKTLVPLNMSLSPRIIPTRIVNFIEQRASFELKTTELDQHFKINRIVVFMKEVFTSYPGS